MSFNPETGEKQGGFCHVDLSLDEMQVLNNEGSITILNDSLCLVTIRIVLTKDYEVQNKAD